MDDLLIPQFKELAGKYGADGVWVDGECWATETDFHPDTVRAFEAETGIDLKGTLPASPADDFYQEYRNFCRECYKRYLRHYVDEVHAAYPDFQIASNWAFASFMPEEISADVDFISGDFCPVNSFNIARSEGRTIARHQFAWDLMAWNFRYDTSQTPFIVSKHPVQIMQEAAAILSIGGGFQNYIQQYRDGSPNMEDIRHMKPVADFIRERAPYCFRGENTHEAVILFSGFDHSQENGALYSQTGFARITGLTALFCDAGQQTEISCEHALVGRCADYGLIVVPELHFGLENGFAKELISYAENGGSLLLTGPTTTRFFSQFLPYTIEGENREDKQRFTTVDHLHFGAYKNACGVKTDVGETLVWIGDSAREANVPGGVIIPFGKGKIGVIAFDIGTQYGERAQYVSRDVIRTFAERLYAPAVKIESALGLVEINTLLKNGKRYIQLVNANGAHANPNSATEDFIPPALDITLSIRCAQAPEKLILRPAGRELPFTYKDGWAFVSVDRLDLYEILEISG